MTTTKFFDTAEVGKLFAGLPFASFDVDALVTSQRKNIEAFTQANQLAVEGIQALAKRQVELARAAIDEASTMVREWANGAPSEEKFQKQALFAKQAFEKSVSSARELVELAGKTQSDAFEVLNKRFTESIDELGSFAKKETKKAARQ